MNWLDIAIAGVIVISALQGRRGLVPSLLPLAGVVFGIFVAGQLYRDLAERLSVIITNDTDALVVGYFAILSALYLGTQMVAALSGPVVALLLLGPWTRTAGMVAGLMTGLLLIDAFLLFQAAYPSSLGLSDTVRGSALAEFLIDTLPLARFLLPSEFDAAAAAF